MGKDGSGEPTPKKLKQSQLCFKSPKTSGNIKAKVASPSNNGALRQSQNLLLSGGSVAKESVTDVVVIHDSPEKVPKPVENCSEGISSEKENQQDLSNVDLKESSTIVIKDDDDPMEVDERCPPKDVVSESNQPTDKPAKIEDSNSSEKSDDPEIMEVEEDLVKNENPIAQAPETNDKTAEVSSKSPKTLTDNSNITDASSISAKTPVADEHKSIDVSSASANESLSASRSDISTSSDSEEGESGANSSSSTPVTPKTPKTPSSQGKRQLTPKMLKRHEESLKKKQLKQRLKEEKRAKLEQMRQERLKTKMEEEEMKKQMKEERKKKRIAEMELKNEEKRQKQEDKRLKKEKEEEEKRKKKEIKAEEQRKEEEKKEQEEKKKERAQAAFVSFFKKGNGVGSGSGGEHMSCGDSDSPAFMPFPVKIDMRLAAIKRRELTNNERVVLDSALSCSDKCKESYLNLLKGLDYTPRRSLSTWPAPVSEELHDCIIIEAQNEEGAEEAAADKCGSISQPPKATRRAKLLQFCENRRPAYFGTWSRRSKLISGRTPFAKDDKEVLDYEVDSDSEWEEDEEGEDLENMKDDKDGEEGGEEEEKETEGGEENGYLLDNTFVPHGYLSDEEQMDEEQIQESVEKQKDRLVALKEEFDEEMKQGAQALKPKLLGCLWVSNSTTQVSKGSLYEVLLNHRGVWDDALHPDGVDMNPDLSAQLDKSPTQTPSSKQLPPFVVEEIARMVDGCRWPLARLVREVGEVVSLARPQNPVSRCALTRAIKNMASKTLDANDKPIWVVKSELRAEYKLEDLEELSSPAAVTPVSKSKGKETLLDNFLKAHQSKTSNEALGAPPAKKRISLTPAPPLQTPSSQEVKASQTDKKAQEGGSKKKVAFVTLPPRTPNSTPQRSLPRTPVPWSSEDRERSLKPHQDTPRPPFNRFLNKTSDSLETVEISDDSNC